MSFFSELKSLAKHVDTSVGELQKDIVESSSVKKDYENHSAAVGQMRHQVKESREMYKKIEQVNDDFVQRNETFTQAFDLFAKVMESHKARLGSVEDHMEKYGFQKKSENVTPKLTECKKETSDEDLVNESEDKDSVVDDTDGNSVEESSKLSNHSSEPMSFEILCKTLSKDTLMILKQGNTAEKEEDTRTPHTVNPSKFFATPQWQTPANISMPEPPKLLSCDIHKNKEVISEEKESSMRDDLTRVWHPEKFFGTSQCPTPTEMSIPQPPKLLSCDIRKNIQVDSEEIGQSMKEDLTLEPKLKEVSSFSLPEPPISSYSLPEPKLKGDADVNVCPEPVLKGVSSFSMPEPPKLRHNYGKP